MFVSFGSIIPSCEFNNLILLLRNEKPDLKNKLDNKGTCIYSLQLPNESVREQAIYT